MIQQVFLSLISGASILFGLDPHSVFFFLEKTGRGLDSGVQVACWAGLINGVVLISLKYRRDARDKKAVLWMALPVLFYQLLCSPYFNEWISDLRLFSWIFAGSLFLCYFLLQLKGDAGKLLYPVLALAAYVSQIPGSAGIFILLLLFAANKVSNRTSLVLVLLSLTPSFLLSFVYSGREFLQSSTETAWLSVSISYLVSCAAIFWSTELLFFIFNRNKEKLLLNLTLGAGIALLFLTSRLGGTLSGEKPYHYVFPSMGTSCEITVWTNGEDGLKEVFEEVQERVDAIEDALSTYKPESEINAMNKTAHLSPFKCSDILWENLLLAEYAYGISNGGFDVTVGPLVKLWSIKKKVSEIPAKNEIDKTLEIVGFDNLLLDKENKTVLFKQEGISVDFGALTKGWAVDKASELLRSKNVSKFIVNLGGNLYCSQVPPEGKGSYKIGIKNPAKPTALCAKVEVLGQAVSTSGNYEQFIMIDGKKYTHIIDPRTGYPVADVDAVTVISPSAALCDILSTAIFVEGSKSVLRLNDKFGNTSVLFIDLKDKGKNKIIRQGLFEKVEVDLYLK